MPLPLLALPIAIGAVQTAFGIGKAASAAKEQKSLRAKRRSFKTTQEVYDINSAATNRAQQGYDAGTLDYLTNQIDRAATGAYGTAKRLGADPNDLSAIFDQQIQATMKVGAENNTLNMENFSKYLGAKELLAKNLEAEWASAQGLIKDDQQAAQLKAQEASAQISNGLSNVVAGASAVGTGQLYKERTDATGVVGSSSDLANSLPPAIWPVEPPTVEKAIARLNIISYDEFGKPIYRK